LRWVDHHKALVLCKAARVNDVHEFVIFALFQSNRDFVVVIRTVISKHHKVWLRNQIKRVYSIHPRYRLHDLGEWQQETLFDNCVCDLVGVGLLLKIRLLIHLFLGLLDFAKVVLLHFLKVIESTNDDLLAKEGNPSGVGGQCNVRDAVGLRAVAFKSLE